MTKRLAIHVAAVVAVATALSVVWVRALPGEWGKLDARRRSYLRAVATDKRVR